MKRLKDEIDLTNEISEITMMDLRKHPGEIFDSVEYGKTIIIKRAGKRIAVLKGIGKPTIKSLENILDSIDKQSRIEILKDGSIIALPI